MKSHFGCLVAIYWYALMLAGPAVAQSDECKTLKQEATIHGQSPSRFIALSYASGVMTTKHL
jgi:hypothetical protein